jgi:TolA-binding protein
MVKFLSRGMAAFTILPFVVFCLISASCATGQSADTMRRQAAALEAENFQLRKDLTEARVRLEMAREGTGQTSASAAGDSAASLAQGSAHSADLPARDAVPRVIYSEPIMPVPTLAVGSSGAPGASASSAGLLMGLAREELDAKDADGALTVFRQIVSRYPDDPLADDAQFGAGECFFLTGRYEDAIAEYRKVVNGFPFGDQVPFAFLKIGFAHLALEQRDLALDNFKNVSEAFPGTEAATVARQQIAHLKASGK